MSPLELSIFAENIVFSNFRMNNLNHRSVDRCLGTCLWYELSILSCFGQSGLQRNNPNCHKYRISADSFRTCMYCHQRSQYIRPNSKKNSVRGNYSRKYGVLLLREGFLNFHGGKKLTFFENIVPSAIKSYTKWMWKK